MSKGYMVFYKGEIWGVIDNKDDFKQFQKERNQSLYDVVKKDMKEIERLLAYRGASQFFVHEDTEEYGDIILFYHEEIYILEMVDEEVQHGLNTLKDSLSLFFHYYSFEENEANILKVSAVLACELYRLADKDYSTINKVEIAKTWLEMMNLDD